MGNIILAASTKSSSTNFLPILIILVLFGLLYVTMIRPQRNRQRQAMQTQNTVVPGARIRTTAGIYGTIVSVEDNDVVVEIAPGVNIRMLRRAVLNVVPDSAADGTGPVPEPPEEPRADDWNPQDRNI
jgi:preprotein translocase subunit YajC